MPLHHGKTSILAHLDSSRKLMQTLTSKRESFTTSPTRLITRSTARQIQKFYQNY
ncbi:hypothetical protein F441_09115, partial [Phytophthora nicotianae CJ01A1]